MTTEYKFMLAFTPDWSGIDNMAVDKMLGEEKLPTLPFFRFYTWDRPTISYGRNQNVHKRLDLELCKQDDIPVVMRPTGGRELLHGHDLCYCACIPGRGVLTGVESKRIFADINGVLSLALRELGVDAHWAAFHNRPRYLDGPCFIQADSGEITVSGRKLLASAQRVFKQSVIQQGSMPLHRSEIDLVRYIKSDDKDALRRKIAASTAYLDEELRQSKPLISIIAAFRNSLEKFYGTVAGPGECLLTGLQRNKSITAWYYQ